MAKRCCMMLLFLGVMSVYACSTHLGGGRIDNKAVYTARSFLVGQELEQPGYGLYSYLLFPAPPRPDSLARYREALLAFLGHPPVSAMDGLHARHDMNIFYLMLMDKPPEKVARCLEHNCYPVDDASLEWILGHYNYARAGIVMHRVLEYEASGPYIVTVLQPIPTGEQAQSEAPNNEALLQDLSTSPPKLVNQWVKLFIDKATGRGSSFERNLRELQLAVYAVLENYAQGLPEAIEALKAGFILISKEM